MEGEATVICVDTSITNLCWFVDQLNAVEIYIQRKLKAHPDNLIGIVGQQHDASCFAPTNNLESIIIYGLNTLEVHDQEYTDLFHGFNLSCDALSGLKDMKKRIVVFSGSPLPFAMDLPEAIADFLKTRHVVLDVIVFGTRVKDKEDSKAKYLEVLVAAMNDNNENEDSRYFPIEDDGCSLSHHILTSSVLPLVVMEGEVTMICVDTSITNLCRFHDQIHAVKIYCQRKLKAHPDNFVSIARFGQRDLGICLDPTNWIEKVTCKLRALKPLEQDYTDLLRGFELSRFGWFGLEDMKKRIVVFSGSPLLSTTGQLPEAIAHFLKERCVVLDVIDFGTRVKDKEDSKAKYLKALVAAMNDNNENEDSHYLPIEDDGLSLSQHISSSSILPSLVAEEEALSNLIGEEEVEEEEEAAANIHSGEEEVDSGWSGVVVVDSGEVVYSGWD